MIAIGVDVHKHSLTAVAVDELGRPCLCSCEPQGRGPRPTSPAASVKPVSFASNRCSNPIAIHSEETLTQ